MPSQWQVGWGVVLGSLCLLAAGSAAGFDPLRPLEPAQLETVGLSASRLSASDRVASPLRVDPLGWLDPTRPAERAHRAVLAPLAASLDTHRLRLSRGPSAAALDGFERVLPGERRPGLSIGGSAGLAAGLLGAEARPHWLRRWAPAAVLAVAVGVVEFAIEPSDDPRWDGRNDFDAALRRTLVGSGSSGRERAKDVSDYLLYSLGILSVADFFVLRDELHLEDSLRADVEAHLANLLTTRAAKLSAARQRPFVRGCFVDPDPRDECSHPDNFNASFWSGHASMSALMAARICDRHLARAEVGVADRLFCGVSALLAGATGVLRITADVHYATDVIGGMASGTAIGLLLPRWLGGTPADPAGSPDAAGALRREPVRRDLVRRKLGGLSLQPIVGSRQVGMRLAIEF